MWTQSSFGTWFVRVHFKNARWSHAEVHGSISVRGLRSRNKISLAVQRSWSWLGRRLQCMWTHVVQITISITFWMAIRNVFRNVILAHVNTAIISTVMEMASITPSSVNPRMNYRTVVTSSKHVFERLDLSTIPSSTCLSKHHCLHLMVDSGICKRSRTLLHKTMVTLQLMVSLQSMVTTI